MGKDTLKATGTYLLHLLWVSGVLLVFGNQPFPWCCFEAAVILLGFQTVKVANEHYRPAFVKARRIRRTR